jgi:hypothetical protein
MAGSLYLDSTAVLFAPEYWRVNEVLEAFCKEQNIKLSHERTLEFGQTLFRSENLVFFPSIPFKSFNATVIGKPN